jgi:hypothetical protein
MVLFRSPFEQPVAGYLPAAVFDPLFPATELLVSAMFAMKHRPLDSGNPLRARRPALLGHVGTQS